MGFKEEHIMNIACEAVKSSLIGPKDQRRMAELGELSRDHPAYRAAFMAYPTYRTFEKNPSLYESMAEVVYFTRRTFAAHGYRPPTEIELGGTDEENRKFVAEMLYDAPVAALDANKNIINIEGITFSVPKYGYRVPRERSPYII